MNRIEELYRFFVNYPIVVTDSRKVCANSIFFALKGANFDGNQYALQALNDGCRLAVVDDRNIEPQQGIFHVDDVLTALQQLAHHHRKVLNTPVIAITGTNGKTTTKELVAAVLQQKYDILYTSGNFNNHIGVPLTLLRLTQEHQLAIIEMGANHEGEIAELCKIAAPNYGLITNVGKAHLEGFGSFEGVKRTKGELYAYLAANNGKIFINSDNIHLNNMVPETTRIQYGTQNGVDTRGELIEGSWNCNFKVLFNKGWLYINTKLVGAYNFENALAAVAIGREFQVEPLQIQEAINSYQPQNLRSQYVKKEQAHLILDTYNANPTSMMASLSHFVSIAAREKSLIIGDMLELGDQSLIEHQKVVDWIIQHPFRQVILVGKAFMQTQTGDKIQKVATTTEAIEIVKSKPFSNNDLVLIKGSRGIKLEQLAEVIN